LKIRENFFKWFFLAGDWYRVFISWITGLCRLFLIISLVLFILSFLFYIGFNYPPKTYEGLLSAFRLLFLVLFLSKYLPELLSIKKNIRISLVFRVLIFLYSLSVFLTNFDLVNHEKNLWHAFYGNTSIIVAVTLLGITEISGLLKLLSTRKIPPSLIFSMSFLLIILIGSGLLLLPKAHLGQLTYIDSLFTAVSAVCVTGLVVVDTATAFTMLGKTILLCMIQIGGLGIMAFTGFFSYIFASSGSSFRDRLLLKEIFSAESLNNLFKLLVKIIILTFITELAGAVIIYFSLTLQVENRLMFSIFHSVSAFCNAGFSTLSEGLFSPAIKYNYTLQISVAVLIVLGGIGFPVLVSVYSYIKRLIIILIRKARGSRIPLKNGKKNISMRIVLFMTGILILTGAGFYYLFENSTSLAGYDNTQKIISSFFGSISARTAGFNMVDISLWSYPTIFLMILLMWIGASPGSTGGGIKTTTFALAFKSVWNNLRGKDHLIIGNREVSTQTITRILSIIFLSIIVITAGFFCLLLSEPEMNPVHLFFECVSAFGTVGLSLADTGSFSSIGKIIVMLLMFIGRVGPLTLFTGFMLSNRKRYSRYPELEIIIN
jgi:trk system potassium uptake protein